MKLIQGQQMVHETEVHAYVYILKELKSKKGWDSTQIFTQNQIRKNHTHC